MEPDDLIARLEEGKVYRAAQAQQALGHFFSKQNLAALREIALRRTADRLNRTARKQHPEGFLDPSDHRPVCLSAPPPMQKSSVPPPEWPRPFKEILPLSSWRLRIPGSSAVKIGSA